MRERGEIPLVSYHQFSSSEPKSVRRTRSREELKNHRIQEAGDKCEKTLMQHQVNILETLFVL